MKEIRRAEISTTNEMTLEGYAIIFESATRIGDYEEIISRNALNETDLSDVVFFYNHDLNNVPLARTPNTLTLTIDDKGLKFKAVLPNTEAGKSVYESVKRGDLRGCSFAFLVADNGDEWQRNIRRINKISKVYECSVVAFPAYEKTLVEARNLKGRIKMKFENVAEAFNYYKNLPIEEIEKRAGEIEKQLNSDSSADVKSLNVELEGMKQAKANIEESTHLLNDSKSILTKIIASADSDEPTQKNFNEENVTSTAEYRSAFYKSLQGKPLSLIEDRAMKLARSQFEKRASEFNTSTNSAAVIPTSTLDEIVAKARKQGGIMAECRAFAVPSKIAIPVATPSDKAAWHVEGAAVDTEKFAPTTVTFDGNEIIKIFSLSVKTQSMTISAFESYLTTELENCVMETIGESLVNGTGVGQGTGLMTCFNSDTTVISAGANIGYKDVTKTIGKLKRGYVAGAKIAMNNWTLWNLFYSMVDSTQRPIFINDPKNETIGKILGFDVIVDDYLEDNVVIFGNFNYMAYNLPSGIVIETSRESSFKSGLIDYRAMAIADCQVIVPEAFVKLTTP